MTASRCPSLRSSCRSRASSSASRSACSSGGTTRRSSAAARGAAAFTTRRRTQPCRSARAPREPWRAPPAAPSAAPRHTRRAPPHAPRSATRAARSPSLRTPQWAEKIGSVIGFLFLVAAFVVGVRGDPELLVPSDFAKLWGIASFFQPLGGAFGYTLSTLARLEMADRKAVCLETGVQSYPLVLALVGLSWSGCTKIQVRAFVIIATFWYASQRGRSLHCCAAPAPTSAFNNSCAQVPHLDRVDGDAHPARDHRGLVPAPLHPPPFDPLPQAARRTVDRRNGRGGQAGRGRAAPQGGHRRGADAQ